MLVAVLASASALRAASYEPRASTGAALGLARGVPAAIHSPPHSSRRRSPSGERIEPTHVAFDELVARGFDERWVLPELELEGDLGVRVAALLAREFDVAAGAATPLAAARSLGDVVALFAPLEHDARTCDALLARIERERPDLWAAFAAFLPPLVRDAALFEADWDPTEVRDDDGFAFAERLPLERFAREPWTSIDGALEQAAVLVFADLDALKGAEGDYSRYPQRAGANFEAVDVVPGSHVRGEDERRGPFSALRVVFEADLPFPFGGYTCDMQLANRIGRGGRLVCDIYSTSRDFHWFAGRDVYFPVCTSQGAWVATIAVRQFGFDLRGVPDGDGHRRESLRVNLGHTKRDAEARFRAHGVDPSGELGRIPDVPVIGAD